MSEIDVFKNLPRLSWRGIELPIMTRTASFQHENVQHKFAFRDNALVEQLGAQNWTFSYTIPFRQGIAKGPYVDLFLRTFTDFVFACRDRSPGELTDPVLGAFRAQCTSLTDESDPNKRDGDDVRVEFVHAPEIDDVEMLAGGVQSLSGLANDSGALDADFERVDIPPEQEPPEPTVNPISAITGVLRQLQFQGNKVSATLDDTAFRAEQLEAAAAALEDPGQSFPIKRSSRRVRDSAIQLKKRSQDPARTIITVHARYSATLSATAANLGMTLADLLRLNPRLARQPTVPAGTPINRYQEDAQPA
jgi:hypothetical protein